MKKILIILLALILPFSLIGCKSPSEMAGEKMAEKILESTMGAKVDIDGDKATFKLDDGSELELGGNEWPTDKLAKDIPKLDGNVTYVANSDVMCMIVVEKISSGEFEKYLEKVKNAGYTNNEVSFSDSYTKTYIADNGKDITFQLTYMLENEEVTITVGKGEN